jgi:hypothetical protein
MMIELHSKTCLCHGGSWMSFVGQSGSPCAKDGRLPVGAVLVPLDQWRAMGKPHDLEEFDLALASLQGTVVQRQFERFEVRESVRLWRLEEDHPAGPYENTCTENLSQGGARVLSQLPLSKGDFIWFEQADGDFRTRAQIREITSGHHAERRLHLRFLDGFTPEQLLKKKSSH